MTDSSRGDNKVDRFPPDDDRATLRNGRPGGGWRRSLTSLKGLGGVIIGLSGAVATLIVGFAVHPAATASAITGSSVAPATKTITPSGAPRQTVTVTASPVPTQPGPVALPGCLVSQGCKGYNLVVRPGDGITFATGAVTPNFAGDMDYQRTGDGALEIAPYGIAATYSTDVTARQANKQGCQALTTSDAATSPIRDFHKGLSFCVAINATVIGGLALVEETKAPGSDGTLHLRELFWPSDNS